jgi:nitric oxide reductase NorD protein
MSEAEDLLVEAALRTTIAVRQLWRRSTLDPESMLARVRSRIELFAIALYGQCPTIAAADPPAPPSLLQALFHRSARHQRGPSARASTDGTIIRLPRAFAPSRGDTEDLALMRLLALEMIGRVRRNTVQWLPHEPIVRDLYLLSEAVAIDAQLARDVPGFARALAAERALALGARPSDTTFSPRQAAVEQLVQLVLASPIAQPPLAEAETPERSLRWAEQRASDFSRLRGGYHGIAPVLLWGSVNDAQSPPAAVLSAASRPVNVPSRTRELERAPRPYTGGDPQDPQAGAFVVKPNAAQQSVEDPRGLARPADREVAPDLEDIAGALSELPEAQLVRSEVRARETLRAEGLPRSAVERTTPMAARGFNYPEWDYQAAGYHMPGAVVVEPNVPLGDASFAANVLRRRAALLREVRQRFECLRLRPRRIGRQLDGDDLDLDAYVSGFSDRRAGHAFDGRLYASNRRMRRELQACVLLDASASTDAWVSGRQRVIDIEKEALLIVAKALDLIADDYALLAFSGESADCVEVLRLKSFGERSSELVHRRIASLEPDRYTRAGAALRHASTLLSKQRARHRLLIFLSDGKPNDVDQYEGRYGVEDLRKATLEARLAGIQVFCLAVDRQAPAYAPRIFGAQGFALLPRSERLPFAVIELLRQLVSA